MSSCRNASAATGIARPRPACCLYVSAAWQMPENVFLNFTTEPRRYAVSMEVSSDLLVGSSKSSIAA